MRANLNELDTYDASQAYSSPVGILEDAADFLWRTSAYFPSSYPSREVDPDTYDALQILREAAVKLWKKDGLTD